MTAIELCAVSKSYARTPVLDSVTLTIDDAFITAILGPSGSGKTTLLRLIAGFERVDHGTITVGGQTFDGPRTHLRPERRGIGYVPQDGALFPHLTVAGNIGFGLARRDRGRVGDLLDVVGLSPLAHRYPHQLSGGQQQRVALARALAVPPRLVLLDEPFSSLDASLRVSLRRDVARVLSETGTPAVIVTHDQDEALSLADRIAILDSGRILADGSPSQLYRAPASAEAARYLGDANLLPAVVRAGTADCALLAVALRDRTRVPDGPATLLVRPEQLCLSAGPDGGGVAATIGAVDYYGHDSLARLALDDGTAMTARFTGNQDLRAGDRVHVTVTGEVIAWPAS